MPVDTSLERALDRWRAADLLSPEQVDDIRAWEEAHDADPSPSGVEAAEEGPGGAGTSLIAEGLGYVGAALAFGAGFALFGELWDDLGSVARIVLCAVGTGIVAAGSLVLRDRAVGSLQRLSSVLAGLTVVGTAGTVAITLVELTNVEEGWVGVLAGLAGLVVAVPLHRMRPSWPTTLATGGALLTAVLAALSLVDLLDGALAPGIALMGIGLAWAAAGWAGRARPRTAFEVTGLLVGGIGVQVIAVESLTIVALLVGLAVAGGAMAVGLAEDRTAPAVLGGLGITVYAPQLVFELFGDTVGGPLALFVGGISLVTVAVTILRRKDVV